MLKIHKIHLSLSFWFEIGPIDHQEFEFCLANHVWNCHFHFGSIQWRHLLQRNGQGGAPRHNFFIFVISWRARPKITPSIGSREHSLGCFSNRWGFFIRFWGETASEYHTVSPFSSWCCLKCLFRSNLRVYFFSHLLHANSGFAELCCANWCCLSPKGTEKISLHSLQQMNSVVSPTAKWSRIKFDILTDPCLSAQFIVLRRVTVIAMSSK